MSKRSIVVLALVLAVLVGVMDYALTTDVDLFAFYWLPVSLVAWYVGFAPGAFVGLFSALIPVIELSAGRVFYRPALGIASAAAIRTLSSAVIAFLVDRLRERTQRLQSAVSELEAFDYSVAHDLRSPLRTITAFAEFLTSRKQDQLDDESRRFLKRICGASLRLHEMLEGLLILSRLSRREVHRETVDLAALSRQILTDLETENGGRRQLRIPDALKAYCDRELATILLHNLLQNAWKFTGQTDAPAIELGVELDEGSSAFYVRDNGAGFDSEHARRLFEPFARLPNAKGLPGHGIGLATAARAVAAHGGRVWAKSQPGKGATFYFTFGMPS